MKYLLTSGGVTNPTIKSALITMLGKPIEECHALCISTASFAFDNAFTMAMEFLTGKSGAPMCELGWKSLGVIELSALSMMNPHVVITQLKKADAILVNGGDPGFLAYWYHQSGFAQLIPQLDAVYVGMSAGSMVLTLDIGEEFVGWVSPNEHDKPLGIVPFSIFPHLDHPMLPENTLPAAQLWATKLTNDAYAIDDATAFEVQGNTLKIWTEGKCIKLK